MSTETTTQPRLFSIHGLVARQLDLSFRPWYLLGSLTSRGEESSPVEVAVGRVDAAVRHFIGRTLSIDELVADAERRRAAADTRDRAQVLRARAHEVEEEAEARREAGRKKAENQRTRARKAASKRHESIEDAAERRKAEIAEQADEAREELAEEADARREAVESAGKRARLQALESKESALDSEAAAVAAADEADRLKKAATKVKAGR